MSSLLEQASICITPNAYKEGKLYGLKGTDLDVVRATTATRVNAEGLIEVVPYNLLQRSEEFDNAYWTKLNSTVITNAITSPSGSLTAETFVADGSNNFHLLQSPLSINFNTLTFSLSIFVKKNSNDFIQICVGTSIGGMFANFNINNGTLGIVGTQSGTNPTSSIQDVGDGWYRCVMNFTPTSAGSTAIQFAIITSANSPRIESNNLTTSVYLWGAQLVQGTQPKEYLRTETRLNIPRLDYTNGSCPSILVEPQRTNLLQRSEEFDNASWVKTNATITANSVIAPDGTLTADTINVSVQDVERVIQRVLVGTSISGSTYTGSIWIKGQGSNIGKLVRFRIKRNSGGTSSDVVVNYTLTSNWVRISATFTGLTDNTGIAFGFDGATNYADSFDVWGAQLELGSNATSYIPTVASAVTRNEDVISKTGISDLIGQSEGTLFLDFIPTERIISRYISLESASGLGNGWIGIFSTTASPYKFRFYGDGFDFNSTNEVQLNQRYKIALSYKNGVVTSAYINGVIQGTLTANTTSKSYANFKIATAPVGDRGDGKYKQVTLWKTALTDQECINLTTL